MVPVIAVPALGIALSSYETLYLVAVAAALVLGPPIITMLSGLAPRRVAVAVVLLALVAFVGSRAFFVVTNWALFASHPASAGLFWRGGRNAPAAVATLLLTAPLVLRLVGLPAGRFCDAGIPVVALALAIARLGCFLHGCCGGAVSTCPWCLRFPAGSGPYRLQVFQSLIVRSAPYSLPVHPLPLYFALAALAIGALAVAWNRVPHRDWNPMLGCTLLFGLTSVGLEMLRADYPGRPMWGSVPALTWLSGAVALGAAMAIIWRSRPAQQLSA